MPIAATTINMFDKKVVCATKGGQNFLTVTRPDPISGLCPGTMKTCSTKT
jgi:hypothetical protein